MGADAGESGDELRRRVDELERALAEARAKIVAQEEMLWSGFAATMVSKQLGQLPDDELDDGIERMLASFGPLIGAERALLWLDSIDGKRVEPTHAWPCTPKPPPHLVADVPWAVARLRALETVHVTCLEDLPEDAIVERASFVERGGAASLVVPLVHRGKAIGGLSFTRAGAPRPFQANHVALARMVADVFASALERRRSSQEWARLLDCQRSFGADPLVNVERLTALAGELMGADCASYHRLERGRLTACAGWRTPPDRIPYDAPERSVGGQVFLDPEDRLRVFRDLQREPWAEIDPNVGRHGVRTLVSRAVSIDGARIGALCVAFQRDFEPTQDQARIYEAIADGIAVEEVRRRAQEQLRQTLSELEATLESTADGILVADVVANPLRQNRRFREMWRIPPEIADDPDAVARHWLAMVRDPFAVAAKVAELYADPAQHDLTTMELLDGRILERYSIPLVVDGALRGRVWSFRDVTERNRAETARALLVTAVEQAGEGVLITDRDGRIEYVNPTFERMSGHRLEQLRGQTPRVLKSGRHGDELYRALWSTIAQGLTWSGRLVNTRADGTLCEVDEVIAPVRAKDGAIVNFVGIVRDVTREHELEEEARQAQKMEVVGRLAGGIAHDFNNLLTAIIGYVEVVEDAIRTDPSALADLREIRTAAERAAALTRQLLAFSRRQLLQPRALDLNLVLRGMENMLRRLIPENVEIRLDLAAALGVVRADPSQLEQVVLNLALNVRDAIDGAGRLTIATSAVTLERPTRIGHDALPAGRYARLSVTDDGRGMDATTLARVFEPFFTTKGLGRGTGLGLATVYGIVRQSGGAIAVESRPGEGSCFEITLPLGASDAPPRSGPPRVARPSRARTLLLVEDEPAVRAIAAKVLRAAGHHVYEAEDGVAALELFAARAAEIDALVTDVIMPRMGGPELVRRACAIRPALPVLFMSGHVDAAVDGFELPAAAAFLPKPFEPDALRGALEDLFETRAR